MVKRYDPQRQSNFKRRLRICRNSCQRSDLRNCNSWLQDFVALDSGDSSVVRPKDSVLNSDPYFMKISEPKAPSAVFAARTTAATTMPAVHETRTTDSRSRRIIRRQDMKESSDHRSVMPSAKAPAWTMPRLRACGNCLLSMPDRQQNIEENTHTAIRQ